MNDLERLVAIHEIGQRMALYCNAMDDHDWAALRPIFTDDAAIGGLDGVPPKGPDHFITWLGEVIPEEMKTVHHIHNLQVDFISDTEADIRCDFAAPTWHRGAQAPFKIRDDWGSYLGRCRKTAQGWRVATFTIQKTHSVVAHIGATGTAPPPRPTTIGVDKVALDDLERLVAIEDIRQLKARYCAAVDGRDAKMLRSVFADDAVLGPMLGVSFANADAFVAWIINTLSQGATTVHHVHNFQVEFLSATEAKGRWRFEFWNWWNNTLLDGGHGFGDYWQYYRKTTDGWRISGFGGALPVKNSGAALVASVKRPLPDLEWLVAVDEIKALKARYCAAVDGRDWKKLRSIFADDVDFGEMRATDDNSRFANPDQFVGWVSRTMPEEMVTAHHVHNFQVDCISATEATGRCELVASSWWTGSGPGPFTSRMNWASYRDRYRKTAQGWRMAALGGLVIHTTEESTVGRTPPWTAFGPSPK